MLEHLHSRALPRHRAARPRRRSPRASALHSAAIAASTPGRELATEHCLPFDLLPRFKVLVPVSRELESIAIRERIAGHLRPSIRVTTVLARQLLSNPQSCRRARASDGRAGPGNLTLTRQLTTEIQGTRRAIGARVRSSLCGNAHAHHESVVCRADSRLPAWGNGARRPGAKECSEARGADASPGQGGRRGGRRRDDQGEEKGSEGEEATDCGAHGSHRGASLGCIETAQSGPLDTREFRPPLNWGRVQPMYFEGALLDGPPPPRSAAPHRLPEGA